MKRLIFLTMCSFVVPVAAQTSHVNLRKLEKYPTFQHDNIYSDQIVVDPALVRVLYFEYNGLYSGDLNPELSKLKSYSNVGYLEISNCFLDSFPKEITVMSDLEILDLSNNALLWKIPQDISLLKKLEVLDLRGCAPVMDLSSLVKVQSLRSLHLSGINTIPMGLTDLKQLTELEISNSPVLDWAELFKIISELPALQSLLIRNNSYSNLEAAIKDMNLVSLDISGNSSLQWSAAISMLKEMSHLRKLILQNCFSSDSIPQDLAGLNKITSIDLSGNQMGSEWTECVPENIGELIVAGCTIEQLPISVVRLTSLRALDLSNNPICSIPGRISALKNLQVLDLSCYEGCYFFQSCSNNLLNRKSVVLLAQLQLKELRLAGRETTSLPGNLSLLPLEILDISYGQFDIIPSAVFSLTGLRVLKLQGAGITKNVKTKKSAEPVSKQYPLRLEKSTDSFVQLSMLKLIDLRRAMVSHAAIEHIQQKVPGCRILSTI